ncbi:MAG: 2,3-bisphosphoglycerate-independent phosphoglycerate mutase [Patescibacteria group bacterium]|jgi:2,3-bisphosphoglycerate-independent phosphoglycerate mutase
MKNELKVKPVVLIILDGWGIGRKAKNNAITQARTPVFDRLWASNPHSVLDASGLAVGLPPAQAGNSEAGHLNIGAGRVVEQDAILISHRINDGSFFHNPAILHAIEHVRKRDSNLHLVGLLTGDQSAHAYPEHLYALLRMVYGYGIKKVFLHLLTDGRDSSPHGAIKFLSLLKKHFLGEEKVATIMGRFYAMDRIKEWERIKLSYNALVMGTGWYAGTPEDAIMQAYNRGENDEYIHPTVIQKDGKNLPRIADHDGIIFLNIRSDRVREVAKAFSQKEDFVGFDREKVLDDVAMTTLTDYGPDLPNVQAAYPFRQLTNTFPIVMKEWRQLYISESEKYAHVTYFFNGGYAGPVAGEERMIIKSPRLFSYDTQPEMNAGPLTDAVIASIEGKRHDIIVMNYPNADMLGHTGNIKATIQAVEFMDLCIGRIEAAVNRAKGVMFVTADHGNADEMMNVETGEIDTAHSINPVPFIAAGEGIKNVTLVPNGALKHIVPTILTIIGVPIPAEMTPETLCKKQ